MNHHFGAGSLFICVCVEWPYSKGHRTEIIMSVTQIIAHSIPETPFSSRVSRIQICALC